MTDRHIAYTVLLKEPIREDDAESIIRALGMIKGVHKVTPVVQDVHQLFAYERIRTELGQKLWKVLYPETKVDPFESKG
jgi:hypothetical protein